MDTNNNKNEPRQHIPYNNFLSKSLIDNPQKGKSIKRRSINNQHVSFEGCQAPEALSANIISPRQLQSPPLSNWDNPSTSYAQSQDKNMLLSDDRQLDDCTLEQDFEHISVVQRQYPNLQIHSTPKNDSISVSVLQNTLVACMNPKVLFD